HHREGSISDEIADLIHSLSSADASHRSQAAERLSRLGDIRNKVASSSQAVLENSDLVVWKMTQPRAR
ncbi:MAG: hypothetical protein ACC628_12050, partial [Pirellulaceae bacterium]